MHGMITALVTPFKGDEVDLEGVKRNVRFQIEQGVDGLIALGTTGEGLTLTFDEWNAVAEATLTAANGEVPVFISAGDNCTARAIAKGHRAKELGADGIMVVTPYYNLPSAEGLYRHYQAIDQEIDLPILIYDNPPRTGVTITPELLKRLQNLSHVCGVKTNQIELIAPALSKEGFIYLVADDSLTFQAMTLGVHGVVSALSNLVPRKVIELVRSLSRGELEEARALSRDLAPLIEAITMESNPIPIKAMMRLSGMPSGPCRLPLCPLTADSMDKIENLLGCYESWIKSPSAL